MIKKNLIASAFCFAVAAMAMLSCSKIDEGEVDVNGNGAKTHVEFYASVADTKATLTPNESETAFNAAWEDTDQITLKATSTSVFDETKPATWNPTSGAFAADFDATAPTTPGSWSYVAKYPHASDGNIPFGSERIQHGNAYNSAYDVMYGTVDYTNALLGEDNSGNAFVIPMHRLTGIAYFHITGGPNEDVVSATLEATGIAAETVAISSDGSSISASNPTNSITITFAQGTAPKATDLQLWFNVIPGSYQGLKLTIITETKTAVLNSTRQLNYVAGKLNKAVLSGLNWESEPTYSEYSIVFIDKTVNSPQSISTNVNATTFIEESSCAYVANKPVSEATKAYYGDSSTKPVRIGTSSAVGSLTLQLSSLGSVSASAITVRAKQYSSGKTKTIGVNDSVKQQPGDDYTDLSFNLDGSAISSIKLDTDGYIYVKSITVTYIEKQSVSLSFGETTQFEITYGDEFTPPTLSTDPSGLTVTYTSSNTDVATVNESTGVVSVVGIGSTTITATFAGDDTYNASSASYSLNVNRALSTSIAEIKEDLANGATSFNANLTNAIVTRKYSNYIAYIQDESAGIYVTDADELTEGDSFSGTISGEMSSTNNQPKITSIDVSDATKVSGATIPEPVVVTIAELNDNMSDYDGLLCKVVKAKANADLATGTNKSVNISQGDNSMTFFTRPSFDAGSIIANHYYNIIGIPCLYNTTKEFVVLSTSDVVESSINWQLSSISITTQPTKISYNVGEYFNPAGLVISALWSDTNDYSITRTETVSYNNDTQNAFSFSPSLNTSLATSNTSVSITYLGKTALQEISVVEAGQEVVVYTLTPANGSNNAYAGNCDIAINSITWNLTGNSQYIPWRIGGKNLNGVDRSLYSKTALNNNISRIEITHGAASSITVNSMTVIVSQNSDFSNPVSTLNPTFVANGTVTVERPDGADWSNCYYKIVYNVTVSSSSNKFLEFSGAKFKAQ